MSLAATKLGLSALALETAAYAQLALGSSSEQELALYLLAHGGASGLLAAFNYLFLPAGYRKPRLPILLLLFGLIFFIPVLGFIGGITSMLLIRFIPSLARPVKFSSVQLPQLDPHDQVGGVGFRQPGMRGFLGNVQAPVPVRLRALVALSNVPTRLASPLLRDLLADPAEDLRLLAYGMLDGQEKKLNSAIHLTLQGYNGAADAVARGQAARKLALLYWELIYQGLVHGDLRRHASEQGLRYAAEALAAIGADPALHFLHGRLLHEDMRHAEAHRAYERALELGLPTSRVVPYLAELAYDQRDFAEVRRLLGMLQGWPAMPRIAPVVSYWSLP